MGFLCWQSYIRIGHISLCFGIQTFSLTYQIMRLAHNIFIRYYYCGYWFKLEPIRPCDFLWLIMVFCCCWFHINIGPKFFGDKVPVKKLDPIHQSTQKKIVMYHNFFRSRVHPPAADMLAMVIVSNNNQSRNCNGRQDRKERRGLKTKQKIIIILELNRLEFLPN